MSKCGQISFESILVVHIGWVQFPHTPGDYIQNKYIANVMFSLNVEVMYLNVHPNGEHFENECDSTGRMLKSQSLTVEIVEKVY